MSVTDLGKQRKEEAERSLLTPLQQQRAQFTSKKRQHGAREADVLKQLEAFKSRVRNEIQAAAADSKEADQAASKPTYTGQVLYNDDEDDSGWLRGRLRFVKHFEDDLRTGDVRGGHKLHWLMRNPRLRNSTEHGEDRSFGRPA